MERPRTELADSGLYRLDETLTVRVCIGGAWYEISVLPGFESDGATIPKWLQPVIGTPDDDVHFVAAIVHDWLYTAHVTDRRFADAVYLDLLRQSGCGRARSRVEHSCVRSFGWMFWKCPASEEVAARGLGRVSKCAST